ncbi:ABC transporter permease subunit [Bacillus sp. DJP31]|uniref:ABC transporter permease subunit n=1 Tax=Bacillus sp. DJP31 TaxID=3409789 RepID=UPI003BB62027
MKSFKLNSSVWAVAPACIFTLFFVGYGIGMSVLKSFQINGEVTLENYTKLFSNKSFLASLSYSLWVTTISTIISIVIGVILAKSLHQIIKNKFSKLVVWIPMLFPHFIWGYMLYLLLSQSGLLSSLLHQIGWINEMNDFPVMFRDQTGIGIILTYVWKEVPFVVLMLLPIYSQVNDEQSYVVKTLGGNDWDVFKTVELPWILPVVVETAVIIISFVLAAVEVPYLLGTTHPKMLPVLAYEWFFEGNWSNRGLSYAAMTLLSMIVIIIMITTQLLFNQKRYRMMKGNGS